MIDNTDNGAGESIAIIGMAGRFPGAPSISHFWRNLREGRESIRFFGDDDPPMAEPTPRLDPDARDRDGYVPAGGVLPDIDHFDAGFFGISPREAALTDPQQRIFLECAWEALEHAGYDPADHAGPIGVFAGSGINTYLLFNLLPGRESPWAGGISQAEMTQIIHANDKDYLAPRVAYRLGLRGPAVSVQTACSTSLAAVCLACESLQGYRCDMALAGGVSVSTWQEAGYFSHEGGIYSPDGHCRAFDAGANGTVFGSGAGIVALKRLEEALADGDAIHAVIRGSAVTNDGHAKAGFTAPGVDGQASAIAEALADADISADTVACIEAHGTGTKVGDPIEIRALCQAFQAHTSRKGYCAVGSVKSNVGHLNTAAGAAGLIKTVLALKHRLIPPTLHVTEPTPAVDWAATPFYVASAPRPWPRGSHPRRAGVSAFGIGGTNAHVIVEEAPADPDGRPPDPRRADPAPSRPWHLLVWSARTREALTTMTANLARCLKRHPDLPLADVSYTLRVGRRAFPHRRFAVCRTAAEAVRALGAPPDPDDDRGGQATAPPPVAFLFAAGGNELTAPTRFTDVRRYPPAFGEIYRRCAEELPARFGVDPDWRAGASPSHPESGPPETIAVSRLVMMHVMARLLMRWGVQPQAAAGRGVGDYMAACLAGVFPLEIALDLALARIARTAGRGAPNATGGAPHEQISRRLGQDALPPPGVDCLCGNGDAPATPEQLMDPAYWSRHPFQPVSDGPGRRQLPEGFVSLRITPGSGLEMIAPPASLSTGRHPSSRPSGGESPGLPGLPELPELPGLPGLLTTLGRLWLMGTPIDWRAFDEGALQRRTPLPTYPFERRRHWIDPGRSPAPESQSVATESAIHRSRKKSNPSDWLQQPGWKQAPPMIAPTMAEPERWLLLADRSGVGEALARRLDRGGHQVTLAFPGRTLERGDDRHWRLDPERAGDYAGLFSELHRAGRRPDRVVHLWSLDKPRDPADGDLPDIGGLLGLVRLVRALIRQAAPPHPSLIVVTPEQQTVMGDERAAPGAAALAAAALVLPLETPGLRCRIVDVAARPEKEAPSPEWLDLLLTELAASDTEPIVALRGRRRWIRRFEPIPPPPAQDSPGVLKPGGAYMITGGLGRLGLLTAEHLARTVKARLVLVGRTADPDIADGECAAEPAMDMNLDALRRWAREPSTTGADSAHSREKETALLAEKLCAAHLRDWLANSGVDLEAGRAWEPGALRRALDILPRHARFFDFFMRVLDAEGIVRREKNHLTFRKNPPTLPSSGRLAGVLLEKRPRLGPLLDLLAHCVRHYSRALGGRIAPLGVLYPDGQTSLPEQAIAPLRDDSRRQRYLELIRKHLSNLIQGHPRRHFTILEIGAGTGILTRSVMPALSTGNITWHFTDIGPSFVREAEKTFAGRDHMRFATLDISRDPVSRGYSPQSVDVVLGLNVVHAAPEVGAALDHLKTLLKPGGFLMLIENAYAPRWLTMIWGLTEGWWHYRDAHLRQDGPLLSLDAWDAILAERGFDPVASFPESQSRRSHVDCGLLAARVPPTALPALHPSPPATSSRNGRALEKATRIRAMEALGAEVMVMAGDVADESRMGAIVERANQRFGPLDGLIHAAGHIAGDAIHTPLARIDAATLENQFHPKLEGMRVLEKVLRGQARDFRWLYSSMAALLGGPGVTAYAAANLCMDSGAMASLTTEGTPWLSINWDRLAPPTRAATPRRAGEAITMTPDEFQQALACLSARPLKGQAAVCPSDPNTRFRRLFRTSPTQSDDPSPEPRPASNDAGQEGRADGYVAPRTRTERALADLWEEILGVRKPGVHDDFFELGGDSLAAIRMMNTLKGEASMTGLYHHPTIAAVAEQMEGGRFPYNGLLHPLIPPRRQPALTLVCTPYAGGHPITYHPLAKALPDDHALYAVALPGHDPGNGHTPLQSLDETASQCVAEIDAAVDGPLALYGHCAGSALTIEIARRLHEAGKAPRQVFLAGALPFAENAWQRFFRIGKLDHLVSDQRVFRYLRKLGGFGDLDDPEEMRVIIRAFRHDVQISTRYFEAFRKTGLPQRLSSPVFVLLGDRDPVTSNHEKRVRQWELFAQRITVDILPDAGHYFIRDRARDVANLILRHTIDA